MAGAVGLTDAKIKGMRAPETGRIEVADKVVAGLRIRVGPSGTKTFIVRKRIGTRIANVTVGRFHDQRFTLIDARKKARTLLNDIEGGGDPRGETRKAKGAGAGTIRALFDDYRKAKAGKRSIYGRHGFGTLLALRRSGEGGAARTHSTIQPRNPTAGLAETQPHCLQASLWPAASRRPSWLSWQPA